MEIDFLWRLARCLRLEKTEIMLLEKKINVKNSVIDYVRYKQWKQYGQERRMNEERLPEKILEQCPSGKRRKGKPRNSWMQEETTGMREKPNGIAQQVNMER